jgi:hypothetical protein
MTEGWLFFPRSNCWHYMDDTLSLCGMKRSGSTELLPDESISPNDCGKCRAILISTGHYPTPQIDTQELQP